MFEANYYSHRGGKAVNEDCAGGGLIRPGRSAWVLADGLGGHGHGEVAAKIAVQAFLQHAAQPSEINRSAINDIVQLTNKAVRSAQAADSCLAAMRTTLCAIVAEQDRLWACNAGDSRCYCFRGGSLIFQTHDHSVVQMAVDLGQISRDQMRFHPDRSKLTRVIGDTDNLHGAGIYEPLHFQPGDAFLLCSDGFWEYVREEEMALDLAKSADSRQWLDYMVCRVLSGLSGQNDNFTVITVMIMEDV